MATAFIPTEDGKKFMTQAYLDRKLGVSGDFPAVMSTSECANNWLGVTTVDKPVPFNGWAELLRLGLNVLAPLGPDRPARIDKAAAITFLTNSVRPLLDP